MAYGSFAVRVAPGHDKSKWTVEIHKTARAALKAARGYAKSVKGKTPQVCVFNMDKWAAKPLCLKPVEWDAGRRSGTKPRRTHERTPYHYAPAGLKAEVRGGRLMSFRKNRYGISVPFYF